MVTPSAILIVFVPKPDPIRIKLDFVELPFTFALILSSRLSRFDPTDKLLAVVFKSQDASIFGGVQSTA